jgi:hypothetical protein
VLFHLLPDVMQPIVVGLLIAVPVIALMAFLFA